MMRWCRTFSISNLDRRPQDAQAHAADREPILRPDDSLLKAGFWLQSVQFSAAVIVTTPQKLAFVDVAKGNPHVCAHGGALRGCGGEHVLL